MLIDRRRGYKSETRRDAKKTGRRNMVRFPWRDSVNQYRAGFKMVMLF